MQRLGTTRQRITTMMQSIRGNASSTADQRQAFRAEFGFLPIGSEATATERAAFARDAVRPILEQRANVIEQLAQESTGTRVTEASHQQKHAAFNRAYRLATDLRLAEKGQSFQAFLSSHDQPV